jgi:hypothetical protein
MSENELESIYTTLNALTLQLGELIIKKNKNKRKESKESEEPEKPEEPWWSIQYYKNSIIINNKPTEEFRIFIREIGGTWLNIKKGWMFSKTKEEEIYASIKDKFPTWKIKDQRN